MNWGRELTWELAMKLNRNNKGSTLIEVMMSAAMIATISVVLVALLIHALSGWSSGASHDFANSQATIAMQKLCNEIRDARTATVSSGVLTVVFPKRNTDPDTGEVVYDLSANDPVTRSYYVSDNKLYRSVSGDNSVVTSDVSSVVFGSSGPRVTITLTAQQHIGKSTSEQQIISTVALRNFRS